MPQKFARLSLISDDVDLLNLIARFMASPDRDTDQRNFLVAKTEDIQAGNTSRLSENLLLFRHNRHGHRFADGIVAAAETFSLTINKDRMMVLGPDTTLASIFLNMLARGSIYESFGPFVIGQDRYDVHFISSAKLVATIVPRLK